MAKKTTTATTATLNTFIINGIQEKKGKGITVLNLSKIPEAMSDFFIICEGNSTTQVQAIADSIEDEVYKNTKQSPFHIEGKTNAQWVLLDYADTVIHIFAKGYREHYALEELWNDAERIDITDL
jgi:ribosome-associated protein